MPNSNTLTFGSAGTFYWQAVFSGDSNNGGPSSLRREQTGGEQGDNDDLHRLNTNPITVGTTDFDTSTLSGFVAGGGGGTVTYTVYSDNHCGTSVQSRRARYDITESNGNVPNSGALTFGSAGTFYWVAAFSGDSNNAGAPARAC